MTDEVVVVRQYPEEVAMARRWLKEKIFRRIPDPQYEQALAFAESTYQHLDAIELNLFYEGKMQSALESFLGVATSLVVLRPSSEEVPQMIYLEEEINDLARPLIAASPLWDDKRLLDFWNMLTRAFRIRSTNGGSQDMLRIAQGTLWAFWRTFLVSETVGCADIAERLRPVIAELSTGVPIGRNKEKNITYIVLC